MFSGGSSVGGRVLPLLVPRLPSCPALQSIYLLQVHPTLCPGLPLTGPFVSRANPFRALPRHAFPPTAKLSQALPRQPGLCREVPPKQPRQFSFFRGNGGAWAGPGSWGQLYGNDSASPWICPVLAEGAEPVPLAGVEAKKKWLGPGK